VAARRGTDPKGPPGPVFDRLYSNWQRCGKVPPHFAEDSGEGAGSASARRVSRHRTSSSDKSERKEKKLMTIAAKVTRIVSVSLVAGALAACATNGEVDRKIAEATDKAMATTNQKIESVASQVETVQQHQKEQDAQIATLSQEAKDALKRAEDAGVIAKGAGKVVFQQTFSDDKVKFKAGKYDLSKDAKAALDELGNKIKGMTDHQYFVEIQGHTDDTG